MSDYVKDCICDFIYDHILVILVVSLVASCLLFRLLFFPVPIGEQTEIINLRSATLDEQDEFAIMLGYSFNEETNYFFCYRELSDESLKLQKFESHKTTLYPILDDKEKAYAEITRNAFDTITQIKLYVSKNTIQIEVKGI